MADYWMYRDNPFNVSPNLSPGGLPGLLQPIDTYEMSKQQATPVTAKPRQQYDYLKDVQVYYPMITGGYNVPAPIPTSSTTPNTAPIPAPVTPPQTQSIDTVIQSGEHPFVTIGTKLIEGTQYSQPKRLQNGFYDCSSFVSDVIRSKLGNFGTDSPTTADLGGRLTKLGFKQLGTASALDYSQVKPGDILIKPKAPGRSGHTMIYKGDGQVIEANGRGNGIHTWGGMFHRKADPYYIYRYPF